MANQNWVQGEATATANGTAINTSTTETILFPNIPLPANYLQNNRTLRLRAFGAYGTTATPTLTFAIRLGGVSGTILAKSGAMVTTSGTGGGASMTAVWELEAYLVVRGNGTSGSVMTMGKVTLYTSTVGTAGTVTNYGMPQAIASGSTGGTTPVAVTADLTVAADLSLTALWGTSNAANNIQGINETLESLN